MVGSRGVSFVGASQTAAEPLRAPCRSRSALIALLLAGAAMTATPVGAVTYDLMGGTANRTNFIDPTTLTLADFVENGTLNLTPAASLTFDGVLRDGSGVFALNKGGSLTTLTLTGANIHSGDTRISGGTLRAGATNTLSANSVINAGGTLDINGFDQTIAGLIGSGGVINLTGPATLTINVGGNRIHSGSITDAAGSALKVRKTGAGQQTLNGPANYRGGTEIAGGVLGFGSSSSLGTGTVEFTAAGAVLQSTGNGITLNNAIVLTTDGRFDGAGHSPVFAGLISGPGRLIKTGSGSVEIDNTGNSYAGTDIEQGAILVGADNVLGAGSVRIQGTGTLNAATTAVLFNAVQLNGTLTVDRPGSTLQLEGVVSGVGGINSNDGATLILAAANTYGGLTQLIGGSIGVGNDLSLGGGVGDLISSGNSTVFAAGPAAVVLPNDIRVRGTLFVDSRSYGLELAGDIKNANAANPGKLSIIGSNTVVLSGANTYSNGTEVLSGTLQVNSSAGVGDTQVLATGTLTGTGTLAGTTTVDGVVAPGVGGAGTLAFTNLNLTSTAILNFELAAPPTIGSGINDLIVVSNSLRLDGTLNITDIGGFAAGTYRLFNYAPGTLDDQGLVLGTTPAGFNLTLDTSISGQINLIAALIGGGPFTYWDGTQTVANGVADGGSGTWNAANTNWTNAAGDANGAYGGSIGIFAGPAGGAVAVVGTQTFDQLQFTTDGYALSGGTLAGGATAEIDVAGTLTAVIASDITAASGLTKSGTGFLRLEGNNILGGIDVDSGTIVVGGINALGAGTLTFADATAISFETTGSYINNVVLNGSVGLNLVGASVALDGVVSGAGPLNIGGVGTLQLVNNNSYTGGTNLAGATTLQIASNAALGSGTAALTFEEDGTRLQLVGNADLLRAIELDGDAIIDTNGFDGSSFGGFISGGAGNTLTKTGAGQFTITGTNNDFLGGTIVDQGSLRIESDRSIGTGSLELRAGTTLVAGVDPNAIFTIAAPILLAGDATVELTGSSLQLFYDGSALTDGTTLTVNSVISGSGGLTIDGAGIIALNGVNTYAGGTTVNNTLVRAGSDAAFGSGIVTFTGPGISGLHHDGAGLVTIANDIAFNNVDTTIGGSGALTLGGTLTGNSTIYKVGAGKTIISGDATGVVANNLYVGAGTLQVDGTYGDGSGQVFVINAGVGTATLAGSGTINANVSFEDGTTLAPGSSPGTLTINGNLSLSDLTNVNFELGEAGVIGGLFNDQVSVSGNLVLDGKLSVTDSNLFGPGVYNLFTYGGVLTDNTLDIASLPAGGAGIVQTLIGGQVNLIITAPGTIVQYWDGADFAGNGVIDGGNGTWNDLNTNWTGDPSALNANWQSGIGVFAGTAGTVTLAQNENFVGLQFAVDGYVVGAAGPGGLTVTAGDFIQVGSGLTATIDAPLSGPGDLDKTGTGNLVLNGVNTISALNIVGGTLTLGQAASAGAGNIDIGDGTILAAGANGIILTNTITTSGSGRVNSGPGIFILDGEISGPGSISQIGTGNLVLNHANLFTNLGINRGTVTLGNDTAAGIGGIALNDGAILAAGVSGLTITNVITTTGSGRVNSGPGIFTLDGEIGGAGSISQIGSGNLVLNHANFFTNLGINTGTVTLGNNQAAGIGGIALNDGAILAAGANGLVVGNVITTTGSGRINSGPGIFILTGEIGGAGSISQIGSGNLYLTHANNFTNLGINTGTVTLGNDTAAGIGGIALNDGGTLAAGVDGLMIGNVITTTGSGLVDTNGFTFTLNGEVGGAGSISNVGGGNLVLNHANNFTNLGINTGTVTLGNDTAAGIGGIALNDGGTLAAGVDGLMIGNVITTTGSGLVDTNGFTFTLNGEVGGAGSISNVGGGNLVLNHANNFTNLGINTGTVTLGNDTAAGIGGIALNGGGTLAAGVDGLVIGNVITTTGAGFVDTQGLTFTLDGQIGGPGSIGKAGAGNLVLNAANLFTDLAIYQGTVTLGTNTAGGIGIIGINDGAILAAGANGLTVENDITTIGSGRVNSGPGIFTLNGNIAGPGSISQIGTGNLVLNGTSSFAAGLGINVGTVTLGTNTAAGTGTIALNDGAILAAGVDGLLIANGIETTGSSRVDTKAFTMTLSGNIGNLGSISQVGTGNLILTGNNTFAAGLGINSGTVSLGRNTAAGTGSIALNAATLAAAIDGLVIANDIETTGGGRIDTGAYTFTLNGKIGNVGGFTKVGTGNLVLGGTSNYLGGTTVAAGRLTVTGVLVNSAVTVATGGTLAGTGSIPSLVVQSGGTVSPGAVNGATGTLTVTGNAVLAAGSTYSVQVSGAASDRLAIGGTASLGGSTLALTNGNAPGLFGQTYTILTAAGGRSGTFTPVFSQFSAAFIPTLTYGANDVRLTLAPASIVTLLGSGANGSRNITNIATAFDAAVAAGFNPQSYYNLFLQGPNLGASLNQLTGEINSANSRTAMADTRYIREAALDRLGTSLGAMGNGRGDAVTTSGDDDHSLAFWARGIGAWTNSDSDGNGAKLDINAKGVATGLDISIGGWKLGALFNYIHSDVDTTLLGSGKVESTGGALYAGYRGDHGFAFGVGGGISDVDTKVTRSITVPGIAQSLRSHAGGTSYQLFGEVSYDLAAAENTRVEPFVRAAYVKYDAKGFSETGGFAGLNVAGKKYDTTVVTAGVRGSVLLGGSAWLKGSAGYQNTSGDRAPLALVALQGTTSQAAIRSAPLDKSAFAGELGIDFRIGSSVTLGAGYNGVIGKNTQDHGVKGTLTIGF